MMPRCKQCLPRAVGRRGCRKAWEPPASSPKDGALNAIPHPSVGVTKPRVATQLIIARHPTVRHLLTPRVKYLQTLVLSRLISHLGRPVTCLASPHVPCPVLRQVQTEVEPGMVVVTDVAHEHTDLASVDFSSVAAPLPLDAHRVRATFGEAAGIKGDDAIGLTQSIGHLTHPHLDQRSTLPWGGANTCLQDLSLDID